MNPKQKIEYYTKYCQSLGLNPLTQPFKILLLGGKQTLYCGREGAAQLNMVHKVSHEILKTDTVNGVYIVTAKASTGDRFTTSTGAVSIEGLKGDALCNAIMKAETKSKRRATLDLLGLGIIDETETETIKGAQTINIDAPVTVTAEVELTEPQQKVYDLLLGCQTPEQLASVWAGIGKDTKAIPKILDLKERLKVELSKQTA